MLRVKNGSTADLARGIREGSRTLTFQGRESGPKFGGSSAKVDSTGSWNTAERVLVHRDGNMRQYQVGVAKGNRHRSSTGRKAVEYQRRARNTGLKLSLIAGRVK
jgi:hypothetical protein